MCMSMLSFDLLRGDVPTSKFGGQQGVWLTTDPAPSGHGLISAREMTDKERQFVLSWQGVLPPKGTRFEDKTAVRITTCDNAA
jgi:hypothetical protein